jgi:hypothetical protein
VPVESVEYLLQCFDGDRVLIGHFPTLRFSNRVAPGFPPKIPLPSYFACRH